MDSKWLHINVDKNLDNKWLRNVDKNQIQRLPHNKWLHMLASTCWLHKMQTKINSFRMASTWLHINVDKNLHNKWLRTVDKNQKIKVSRMKTSLNQKIKVSPPATQKQREVGTKTRTLEAGFTKMLECWLHKNKWLPNNKCFRTQ